jgi:hypothetical protein
VGINRRRRRSSRGGRGGTSSACRCSPWTRLLTRRTPPASPPPPPWPGRLQIRGVGLPTRPATGEPVVAARCLVRLDHVGEASLPLLLLLQLFHLGRTTRALPRRRRWTTKGEDREEFERNGENDGVLTSVRQMPYFLSTRVTGSRWQTSA